MFQKQAYQPTPVKQTNKKTNNKMKINRKETVYL